MPQEVRNMRTAEPLDELAEARPDTGQAGDRGEEGEEYLRPHPPVLYPSDRSE